jgi:F-box protein 11
MSYCLNPQCQNPQNPDGNNFCQQCGTKLLLKDQYRAISPLGQGGMGRTFRAVNHGKFDEPCVIKQLSPPPHVQQNPAILQEYIRLFNEEARRLYELGAHPQIPDLIAYFEQDGQLYLVQELIDGQNLLAERNLKGLKSENQIRELLADMLPVVKFIHDRGVIHRDIKPDNIIRRQKDSKLVLIDFGVAKQLSGTKPAQAGTRTGTKGYAPTEQLQFGKAYPASDLYALGATCLHLLTGTHPSRLHNPVENRWFWRDRLPPGTAVSDELGQILDKLLQELVKDRYQSADEVIAALTPPKAQTLVVAKLGPADFRTIGEALKNAQPGGSIQVRPGLYRESVVIDKPVEILGDGPVGEIAIETADSPGIVMRADCATVRGLTVRRRGLPPAGGDGNAGQASRLSVDSAVWVTQGCLMLEDCDIVSETGPGIAIDTERANPAIRRCAVHDSRNCGILFEGNSQGTVEDCDIFGNAGAGVGIKQGSNPLIRGCQLRDGKDAGVCVSDFGQGILEECDIRGNAGAGVAIVSGSNPVIRRCKIHDGLQNGIWISDRSQGIVEDCDIFGNAYPGVGVTLGSNPRLQRCQIHGGKNVGVYFCHNSQGTVEDCDIFGNDAPGVEITKNSNPTIRRCKIRNGRASGVWVAAGGLGTVVGCHIFGNAHSGVGIVEGSNPVIRSCEIRDGQQNGVWITESGMGTVEDCDIFGNVYPGVGITNKSNPVIRGCTIRDGKQNGIWIAQNARGTFVGCDIFGNAGAQVRVERGSNPAIERCQIHDGPNTGVSLTESAQGTLVGCNIFGHASAGVRIAKGSNCEIRRCKIYGNSYGLCADSNGSGTVENCDLTGNSRGAWDIAPGCSVAGTGNKDGRLFGF